LSNLVVSLGPSLITHEFWVHTFGRSETLFLGSFDTISVGFVSLITGGVILLLDHDEKLRDNDTRQQETEDKKRKKVSTMSIPKDRDKKKGSDESRNGEALFFHKHQRSNTIGTIDECIGDECMILRPKNGTGDRHSDSNQVQWSSCRPLCHQ
tara:strand:- start:319 stop:777 length:459 start_codon:yes stop_codon:yes gene_type:complete